VLGAPLLFSPLSPRLKFFVRNYFRVRICVIFNPAARGDKARHFCRLLGDLAAGDCAFKATAAAGDARRLARESVVENFELIVAAGGDGTVNEVLNGLGDAPNGFEKTRLGVLPLGTVNVLARELKIPARPERAWEILRRGREIKMDLPRVEFSANGKIERRYFVQLAGAGFDARAIELASWKLKRKIGPLAYVVAGLKALRERKPKIIVRASGESAAHEDARPANSAGENFSGELVLIGNGKFYGGSFSVFPGADLRDGRLDVCVFPKVNLPALLRCGPNFLFRRKLPEKLVGRIRVEKFELISETPAAFELDGEWAGHLPATFSVEREKLRVVVP
jgi:YegS/Rv2252/BmrU family lipid kinase